MGKAATADPRDPPLITFGSSRARTAIIQLRSSNRFSTSMPKDSIATKHKLLEAGQHLFATVGLHTVASKDIVARAQQKNVSALQYHFGGREGLLFAIIARHNADIETERAQLLDQLDAPTLEALVHSVVVPFARKLGTPKGREFLLIAAQLGEHFDQWNVSSPETPVQVQRALFGIAEHLAGEPYGLPPEVRHERITRFLALVSEALGSRARLHSRRALPLSNDQFVANLIDISIGALTAVSTVRTG